MSFYVGQRVVCVDDAGIQEDGVLKGGVYAVERTYGTIGIDIEGHTAGGAYLAFKASRFRPVAEKPASMDIIRSIVLDPSKPIPDDPREPKHVKTPEEVASIPGAIR